MRGDCRKGYMSRKTPGAEMLRALGMADGDDRGPAESTATFEDGADFRIEVPVVNSLETLSALVRRARLHRIRVNRVTETLGLFRHTRREISDYLALARDEGLTPVFSVGPRATYDTSASRLSPQGSYIGYRLRGMDQIRNALDDVLRGIDLGCRQFVVYDEGLLRVLSLARSRGQIPADVRFKASAHMGCANPVSASLLAELGADSINPVRDLPLAAMAAIRQLVDVPLDLHTDNPPASGGFIRTFEAADIVRVARPVHLKTGNSALARHGQTTDAVDGERMADQAAIVSEMLERFAPELRQSPQASTGRTPEAGLPDLVAGTAPAAMALTAASPERTGRGAR
ncbi:MULTISPECIES: peptidase [unclassified Streptomyces]|uniref:peptidase n=1 Tax=unclassified Streptomyces TaxID=2593676 RepID=UPI0018F2DB54|nr:MULTISPECIES: peptidase [unclassified Streptomyces]